MKMIRKRYFSVIVPNIKSITGIQLREQLPKASLIDVRERVEIERNGKIKTALNIPFVHQDLFSAALSDIKKNDMVNRFCMIFYIYSYGTGRVLRKSKS